jgi:exodeoxyribonuclease V alpha subunit
MDKTDKNVWISDRFSHKVLSNFWREQLGSDLAFWGLLLHQKFEEGSTCLNLNDKLKYRVYPEDDTSDDKYVEMLVTEEQIAELRNHKSVGCPEDDRHPLVLTEDKLLYLQKYFKYEQELLEDIRSRLQIEGDQQSYKLVKEGKVNESQLLGVYLGLRKQFSLITGGPGTGKTSIIARLIVSIFMNQPNSDLRIALAAPTGKAAARMSESIRKEIGDLQELADLDWDTLQQKIPEESFTIHRLLQYHPMRNSFGRNGKNPLPYDLVILDEATMIDLPLLLNLFRAIPKECKVIMLGDKDQLTSVGVGSVFADLVAKFAKGTYSADLLEGFQKSGGTLPNNIRKGAENPERSAITVLDTTYRFKVESRIYEACQAVKSGNEDEMRSLLLSCKDAKEDFIWYTLGKNSRKEFTDKLKPLVDQHFKPLLSMQAKTDDDFKSVLMQLKNFCLLSPIRLGTSSVDSLNKEVVKILHSGKEVDAEFHGMPIMIQVNDYQNHLYNGDLGVLVKIGKEMQACFPCSKSGFRLIPKNMLPDYDTAYAMTIHKSQGSEYEEVMVIIPDKTKNLSRELLYTGISRGKTKVICVGKEDNILNALDLRSQRASGIG